MPKVKKALQFHYLLTQKLVKKDRGRSSNCILAIGNPGLLWKAIHAAAASTSLVTTTSVLPVTVRCAHANHHTWGPLSWRSSCLSHRAHARSIQNQVVDLNRVYSASCNRACSSHPHDRSHSQYRGNPDPMVRKYLSTREELKNLQNYAVKPARLSKNPCRFR